MLSSECETMASAIHPRCCRGSSTCSLKLIDRWSGPKGDSGSDYRWFDGFWICTTARLRLTAMVPTTEVSLSFGCPSFRSPGNATEKRRQTAYDPQRDQNTRSR